MLLVSCISVALFSHVDHAISGEWTQLPPADEFSKDCNFEFSGKIQRGDLVNQLDNPGWVKSYVESNKNRICLNSPGGNLGEVLRFIREVEKIDETEGFVIATKVKKGDVCLSSCAILFMFGQSIARGDPYPDRILEPGAKLGFHTPFIDDAILAQAGSGEAFKVAIEISKLLADRAYSSISSAGPALPPELIALVLGTPANKMRYVNKIGELILLDIGTNWIREKEIVLENRRKSIFDLMKLTCINNYALTFRHSITNKGYSFNDIVSWANDHLGNIENTEVIKSNYTSRAGQSESLVALFTGPFFQPHWLNTDAMMYCRAEFYYEVDGNQISIKSYDIDFDLLSMISNSEIPEKNDRYQEVEGGIFPLDMLYE